LLLDLWFYVCFVDRCLSFCLFSFGHCVVCSFSIYGFWLTLWYLQSLHTCQVFRISKKNRQHNGQKKISKRTNNDLQNIHKIKDRVTTILGVNSDIRNIVKVIAHAFHCLIILSSKCVSSVSYYNKYLCLDGV
jgi:hypothetical protein